MILTSLPVQNSHWKRDFQLLISTSSWFQKDCSRCFDEDSPTVSPHCGFSLHSWLHFLVSVFGWSCVYHIKHNVPWYFVLHFLLICLESTLHWCLQLHWVYSVPGWYVPAQVNLGSWVWTYSSYPLGFRIVSNIQHWLDHTPLIPSFSFWCGKWHLHVSCWTAQRHEKCSRLLSPPCSPHAKGHYLCWFSHLLSFAATTCMTNWKPPPRFSLGLMEHSAPCLPVMYNPHLSPSNPSKPHMHSFTTSIPVSDLESTNPYGYRDKIHIPHSYHSVLPFPAK